MQIEVLSVNVNTIPTKTGSYDVAEVAYKDLKDGKVNGKKIMSFVDKKVFTTVKNATAGQKFVIDLNKDKEGYWQWTGIRQDDGTVAPAAPTGASTATSYTAPRSNYETAEERAIRQNYIIRQSCLSNAIGTLKTEKNIPTADEVKALAEEFVTFIYNKPEDKSGFDTMSDDIPY